MNLEVEIAHAALVRELVKAPETILLHHVEIDLIHAMMGICGEAGELMDAIKQQLRSRLNITREMTLEKNVEKLRIRYGEKYSDAAAHARADKVAEWQDLNGLSADELPNGPAK
jgi:hypothetical protein